MTLQTLIILTLLFVNLYVDLVGRDYLILHLIWFSQVEPEPHITLNKVIIRLNQV